MLDHLSIKHLVVCLPTFVHSLSSLII